MVVVLKSNSSSVVLRLNKFEYNAYVKIRKKKDKVYLTKFVSGNNCIDEHKNEEFLY